MKLEKKAEMLESIVRPRHDRQFNNSTGALIIQYQTLRCLLLVGWASSLPFSSRGLVMFLLIETSLERPTACGTYSILNTKSNLAVCSASLCCLLWWW